jgi:hypothetical protein
VKGLLALAVAFAVLAGSGGSAQGAGCSRAAATAAIRRARPHIPGLGGSPILVTPETADELICFDFTRDGRADLAVTVASGGTAGDTGWFVLRRAGSGWRLALARSGYKLGLFRVGGDLVVSQPVYRKNDPNCCPTGGFLHRRFHWTRGRFTVVRTWKSKSFHP